MEITHGYKEWKEVGEYKATMRTEVNKTQEGLEEERVKVKFQEKEFCSFNVVVVS